MNDIPKYVFDKEYSTQWRREVQFLEDKGIAYTYAKKHYKYPIIKYKYAKTPELFLALAEFYNTVRNEKVSKDIQEFPLEDGYIAVKAEELSEPEKELITEDEIVALVTE